MNDPCDEISKLAKRYFNYKYKSDRSLEAFKKNTKLSNTKRSDL